MKMFGIPLYARIIISTLLDMILQELCFGTALKSWNYKKLSLKLSLLRFVTFNPYWTNVSRTISWPKLNCFRWDLFQTLNFQIIHLNPWNHRLGTPDEAFFQWYLKLLGLGRQIGLINLGVFSGIFGQTIGMIWVLWVPCP